MPLSNKQDLPSQEGKKLVPLDSFPAAKVTQKGIKENQRSVCQVLPRGHGWELESRGQVKGTAAQCSSAATCPDSQQAI